MHSNESSVPPASDECLSDDVIDARSIHDAVKRMLDAIFASLMEAELARNKAQAAAEREADVVVPKEAAEASDAIVTALVSEIFLRCVNSTELQERAPSTGNGALEAEGGEEKEEAIVRDATGLIFANVLAAHGEQPRVRHQYTRCATPSIALAWAQNQPC